MKIFISGGTGFVGGHLCGELVAGGHEVTLLSHNRTETVTGSIRMVRGDVSSASDCIAAAAGCDVAINLVGIIREFPLKGITYEQLHVKATENMLAAARENGISRFLQMSALGSRPGAVSGYHRSKYRAEELVMASGLDYTIFRPSLIYGPKDAFVNMIAGFVRSLGVVPVIGDGSYRLQPIAADDVARCFALAIEKSETIGKGYNLCGNDRMNYIELVDAVAAVLGKSCIKVRNPLFVMKLMTPLLEWLPFYPVTSDQITMLLEESICDGSWQETFGFKPVAFREGISGYLQK